MTTKPRHPAGPADVRLLEITPPRVPRHLLSRPRLALADPELAGGALFVIQAPAGYGKTSLLAQWRLECLARGSTVAWLRARPYLDPPRLVQALAMSVRRATAMPRFGQTLVETLPPPGLEPITTWLADVAHQAADVVLMVDEAEALPPMSLAALGYLMHNAPPNLRVAAAARPEVALGIDDLVDYGACLCVGSGALRFTLDETLALARDRLGPGFEIDRAAQLHRLTEGWPLGVQLALAASAAGRGSEAKLGTRVDLDLREWFVASMEQTTAPGDLEFLTRVAIFDALHPQLCEAVTDDDQAAARLARLSRDTPILVADDHGGWVHMHALAREALRARFAQLPGQERAALHARAAQALAGVGWIDAAAEHALAAGQRDRAFELAERGLYDSIMGRGRQEAVIDWLGRLPPEEVESRPRLLLAAAWSLAVSERHGEAVALIERLHARGVDEPTMSCEVALVLGGAAIFADDPDRFAALHAPWANHPPLEGPVLLQVQANRRAYLALLEGDPSRARLLLQQAPVSGDGPAQSYVSRWGEVIVGLSYLWEGQVPLAQSQLAATLCRAEAQLGRRSIFACTVAAMLSAAVWDGDRPEDAAALLADRIDVLERHALPEAVLLAFRTLAGVAACGGVEHRALDLLGTLSALGRDRAMPRLVVASLADQVRLHAWRFRAETCAALCAQIDAVLDSPAAQRGPIWQRQVRQLRELAGIYAAVASQDWRRALLALPAAEAQASALRQDRLGIELMGLRAFALDRCGERAEAVLDEALSLAQARGLARVLADVHPGLRELVRRLTGVEAQQRTFEAGASPPAAATIRAAGGAALTPKEREVLGLLTRNLSNKEIGLALQVAEVTVKWHLKNLFAKLDAGSRKQLVSRARGLGLVEVQA